MRTHKLIGLVAFIALAGLFIGTGEWLASLARPLLSVVARSAFNNGRTLATLVVAITFNLSAARSHEPTIPAWIDPAGNRVLQGIWRDRPTFRNYIPENASFALIVLLAGSVFGLGAYRDLSAPGDLPLGFLAGFGSVIVAIFPSAAVLVITDKVWPSLELIARRPPTPAPAP